MAEDTPIMHWREGAVDRTAEHFGLWYDVEGISTLVALVAATPIGPQMVQILADNMPVKRNRVLEKLHRELDFYLMKPQEPDIRTYMRYHCTTASNIYSEFHWALIEGQEKRAPGIHPIAL